MFRFSSFVLSIILTMVFISARVAHGDAPATQPGYSRWKNGPSTDPSFFPIAVWLQNPSLAAKYKAAGINLYVGLWKGPTEVQLKGLAKAHMPVICEMNEFGKLHKDDPEFAGTIVGWLHGDEPDNAQEINDPKTGKITYGPPIPPGDIVSAYEAIAAADSTRPIMLNLGQGVANDDWKGRGDGKSNAYPAYMEGGDIVSFDVYPVANINKPDGENYLWLVPQGIDRLLKWGDRKKIVWNCIECTHIGHEDRIATPHQVKAEVWMSLIHGSSGLIYFVHQFAPKLDEHALLDEPEMLEAVTAINLEIRDLAPALNSSTLENAAIVTSSKKDVPIDVMVKRQGGFIYVFAVGARNGATQGTISVKGLPATAQVEVIGETRTITSRAGEFTDEFAPYDVHLYRIRN